MSRKKIRRKIRHFKQRLMERFGTSITDEELDDIVRGIRNYSPKPIIVTEDGRISFHPLIINGYDVVALYDWNIDYVVTVYRKDWFHTDKNGRLQPGSPKNINKAKHRRYRDRRRGLAGKAPHKEKLRAIDKLRED